MEDGGDVDRSKELCGGDVARSTCSKACYIIWLGSTAVEC